MRNKKFLMIISIIFILLTASTVFASNNTVSEYDLTLLHEGGFPEYVFSEEEYMDERAKIHNELSQRADAITISIPKFTQEQVALLYESEINASPEFYYVTGHVAIEQLSNEEYIIYPQYETYIELMATSSSMNQAVNDILAQVNNEMTDIEKMLAVHDYMLLNYEYDLTYSISDARNFFINKRGVCQAYAEAFEYIMDKLGIPCTVVSSRSMDHAWNMVQFNGQWYHIDVTWDDPTYDTYGVARHEYFMLSDDAISDEQHSHYGWKASKKATDNTYDSYFWVHTSAPLQYYNGDWYWARDYGWSYDGISVDAGVLKYSFKTNTVSNVLSPSKLRFVKQNIYNGYMYLVTEYCNVYVVPMNDLTENNIVQVASFKFITEYENVYDRINKLNGWYIDKGRFLYALAEKEYYEEKYSEAADDWLPVYSDYYRYRRYFSENIPVTSTVNQCGNNLIWNLDDDGTLTISGRGDMWGWSFYEDAPWQAYNNIIKTVVIENRVTSIGAFAFYKCINLARVKMPDSVTQIGEFAFDGCSGMTSIKISDKVVKIGGAAFGDCYNITTITIPDGITNIEASTFSGCKNLSSIAIPYSVTNIENSAFGSCSKLKNVYYCGTKEQWDNISIYDMGNYYISNATINCDCDGIPTVIKDVEVNCSENKYTFNVLFDNAPYSCDLITVLYAEDGTATGIKFTEITPSDNKASVKIISDRNADSAKVFIWSSVYGLKPLCASQKLIF